MDAKHQLRLTKILGKKKKRRKTGIKIKRELYAPTKGENREKSVKMPEGGLTETRISASQQAHGQKRRKQFFPLISFAPHPPPLSCGFGRFETPQSPAKYLRSFARAEASLPLTDIRAECSRAPAKLSSLIITPLLANGD